MNNADAPSRCTARQAGVDSPLPIIPKEPAMPEPTFLDDLLEFMAVSDAALHRRRTRVAGTRGATAVAVNRTRSIAPTGEAYAANCVAVTVHDNESGRHLTSTLTADQARELLDVLATYVAVVDSIQADLDHEAATR